MKSITIKISDELDHQLRKYAASQQLGISETLRRALSKELEGETDFASLAGPYQGMFKGPSDLSAKEGYAGPKSG